MKYQTLNGVWNAWNKSNPAGAHNGNVPGSVYSILLADGTMNDPYWRDNELETMDLMKQDWVFERSFSLDGDIYSCPAIELSCKGLDTICDVYINGVYVGHAENMHRHWTFDIKQALKNGENTIRVEFKSPVNYIKEMDAKEHWGGSIYAMQGFPYIRKAHCMFGWDWGPRLPDIGIWKDIDIIGIDSARIIDWKVRQIHHHDNVQISVSVEKEGAADVVISLLSPDGTPIKASSLGEFIVENPELWWPNGLGDQPLYTLRIELFHDGLVVDSITKRIGLRTISLTRKPDEWGESFSHCVNGVDFFAMGADYIPEDNILSRITPERTRKLLADCKAANFNAIRIWGGGYYPSDEFFDACDEFGLVVWHDLMFACANYPIDAPGFEENISKEIIDNVRRIRHHASLGLWCGNNEMEMYTPVERYNGNCKTKASYIRMYQHIIPHILEKEDPITPYWPSSPSSGGNFDNPTDPNRGDSHCWDVWHGRLPFSEYRNDFFRYVSEFGFQSFPCKASVKEFSLPEDWNIFSRVMETHQRNEGANGLIMTYIAKNYLYPADFDVLLYASQLLQAEAMKYGVEHWRRYRGRCMGAIYWQLNDIWPVASWASIDYYGRWKALHYFAKRFFEPIHLSCEEYGECQDKTSIIQEPHGPVPVRARLNVTNETQDAVEAIVKWQLRNPDGSELQSGEIPVDIPAMQASWIEELDFSGSDFRNVHLSYQLYIGEELKSFDSVLFTEPKYYRWQNPELGVEREGNELVIRSSAYAKAVEIYSDTGRFLLSDNYFDMEPGVRRVKILEESGTIDFCVRSVWDIR